VKTPMQFQTNAHLSEPVILINTFTVPVNESERFFEAWKDNARIMAQQPGMIRARLCRSLDNDTELRFVNVAEWASGTNLDNATANPEWVSSVRRMLDDPELHITARPAVYQIALDVRASDHPG
jgi:heme-degrading monooxygenase HmoA